MPSRRQAAEDWWPLVARILAFFFGAYLIYQEQQPPPGVDTATLLVGVGCMGPTIATTVAMLVESVRGTAPPRGPG